MTQASTLSPYVGNILIDPLGPLLSREDAVKQLLEVPPRPGKLKDIPRHVRRHMLMEVRNFHVPPEVEGRLFETVDLMLRRSYLDRNPVQPGTWRTLSGEVVNSKRPGSMAFGAAVEGPSGSGKTEGSMRCLNCFPELVVHDTFPKLAGPHTQVVWLSIDVPASGSAEDLARALMLAWERRTGSGRFAALLQRERYKNPMAVLDEWRQVALSHFLGVLHLDEVQNFFKIGTLEQRRKRKAGDILELSIIEDRCLKWILTLLNTWGMPVVFSGTPDGIGAITNRLSNLQRFATGGFHAFSTFGSSSDPSFEVFLKALWPYQYVQERLKYSAEHAELIFQLSGGVQRIIVALWIAANRIALERDTEDLRVEDFKEAARSYLAPLAPAVFAILSKDLLRMARYEDLVSRDSSYWGRFWQRVGE